MMTGDFAHRFIRLTSKAHVTAGGHLFALLEEEHSEQLAAEITSALLLESEGEILHMLRARDALDSQVGVKVLMHRVSMSERACCQVSNAALNRPFKWS